jgi:hypothetical protein
MPRYAKPRRSRLFYVRLWIVPALAVIGIAAFFYAEFAFRHQVQTNWIQTTATIEDTRTRPLARYALEYGSKGLYEVDVLATYAADGRLQKDWIPIAEAAKSLPEAKSQAATMKGKLCTVRWDPAAPDQKFAELR